MGCSGSKQKKLDLSDSSYTSSTTTSKSNRKVAPKVEASPPNRTTKTKQTKAKQTTVKRATALAVAGANDDSQNGDQIDGNKVTVQRSVAPQPSPMPLQPQQAATESVKSTRPTTTAHKTGWTDEQLLCQLQYLDYDISTNIVRLFDEGNTIPFMCRYRRELIGNLDADK